MTDDQRTSETACWLALLQGGALKRQTAKEIIQRWCVREQRPLGAAFGQSDVELAQELGLGAEQIAQMRAAERGIPSQETLLRQLDQEGVGVLTRVSVAYPECLAQHLPEERLPYILFYRGELALLTEPAVAVLGSAAPDAQVQSLAADLARQLAQRGHTLVGGYARGIDRLVLDAARREQGLTVVVLPMGLRLFGRSHGEIERGLREGHGLLLSPFPVDAEASESAATARIPLVAALCELVVLIDPETGPAGWPAFDVVRAAQLPVCVYRGASPAQTAAWLEAGASPFDDCGAGVMFVDRSMGLDVEESVPQALSATSAPSADEKDEEEPLPFEDAEAAIRSLGRSGRVPEALARRLRETRWH